MDLKKVFDTVNHQNLILLGKLELYGVRGLPLQLLGWYLSDRFKFVRVNQTFSNHSVINIGVPQVSILGPLLFNVIN